MNSKAGSADDVSGGGTAALALFLAQLLDVTLDGERQRGELLLLHPNGGDALIGLHHDAKGALPRLAEHLGVQAFRGPDVGAGAWHEGQGLRSFAMLGFRGDRIA